MATAVEKTTAQTIGTAKTSGATGLKFLTIHVTPEPSGMAAAGIHSQNVQFDATTGPLVCPIAES